jgi:hypothetical protein
MDRAKTMTPNFVSSLSLYKIIFITELLIAEILTTYNRKKRDHFALRAVLSVVLLYTLAVFFPVAGYNSGFVTVLFVCLFTATLAAMKVCYREKWHTLLFCGLLSYTVQHLAYEIFLFLTFLFNTETIGFYGSEALAGYEAYVWLIYGGVYSIVYWFMWAFVEYPLRMQEDLKLSRSYLLFVSAGIFLIDIILGAIVVYEKDPIPVSVQWIVYIYSIVSCAFAILLLFFMLKNQRLADDLDLMEKLWREDKKMYELTKENAELINLKCHDLKHRLEDMKAGERDDDVEREMANIENAIKTYDSALKTGNDELDIILSRKLLQCQKEGIACPWIVDGEAVAFLPPTEMYSLFENALSNAVEAMRKEEDAEKKIIRLKVTKRNGVANIHVENYCSAENTPVFSDGLPKTTKKDANYHGYGVRSMQMVAEKLGGGIYICVRDEQFVLDIVLPIPDNLGKKSENIGKKY